MQKAIANNKCSECNEYYSCYLCDYVEERYQQGRTDAIDELETELIDIIQGNENFIDWQKQEISLCLECAIETIKEQNNADRN